MLQIFRAGLDDEKLDFESVEADDDCVGVLSPGSKFPLAMHADIREPRSNHALFCSPHNRKTSTLAQSIHQLTSRGLPPHAPTCPSVN